jgi:hypothetical protein
MSVEAPPRPSQPVGANRSVRALILAGIVVLAMIIAWALVVLNSGDGDGDSPGQPAPISIPLDGRESAVVQIDSGADAIVVSSADLGTDLAVVTAPDANASGIRPHAEMNGDKLRVWTEETSAAKVGARVQIDVRVARGVRWDVQVSKGARQVQLALGTGKVHSIELSGGADQADISLPFPDGELVARIPTGMSVAAFHLPDSVPAQVHFGAGAGRATVDDAEREGIAAGTTIFGGDGSKKLDGKSFAAAADRVLIDVPAGLGTLSVDRIRPTP